MLLEEGKKATRIWPVLRVYTRATLRYPWVLATVLTATVGIQFVNVVSPLYLKQFIDVLSQGSPSDDVVHTLFTILGMYALLGGVNWFGQRMRRLSLQRMEANVMADLSNDAFQYLVSHSHEFFINNFTGTLTRRVTRFARSYEQVFDSVNFNFIPTILFSVGTIAVLYSRNHLLGIMLLLWVLAFVAVQIVLVKWRHPLRLVRAAEDSKLTGVLSDAVGNHSAIALFSARAFEEGLFASFVERWRSATARSWNADAFIQSVQHIFSIAIEVGLLGAGVLLWQKGIITVGDFVLIQVYILGLVDQVWNIGNTLRRLYDSFADASEMVDIMELPRGITDAPDATTLVPTKGSIVFEHVGFQYHPDRPILRELDLHISGGEKIALVGPSGAGKSTVTKLLLRQYDVTEGSIMIDGQDIRSVTQDSLHEAIAYVPQEPILFHRTLRENIAYGKRDATEEQIIEAAKGAHCHEFISALSDGYGTYVGERGVKLSGGERQRVAIARAILKNAPILILDEATSSLDSESEALIQDALAKLMEGKTVIAIAHRLSTIMKMDRIIVMENGKAVLSGTHNELLAQESNLYKKLWEIQAGSFMKDES